MSGKKGILLTIVLSIIILYSFSSIKAGEITSADEFTKAVIAGDTEKIKELLYKDPNFVNIKDDKGSTPLHMVVKLYNNAKYPRMKVMELLVFGMVQITDYTINGLYRKVDTGKLKKLINKKFIKDDLKKELGKSDFSYEEIKLILEESLISVVDVNAQDNDGKTPLHYAVNYCSKKEIELLLSRGACIYLKDKNDKTPLSDAPSKEFAELLISKGINNHGYSSLYLSVDMELVEFLISKGVDVNIQDSYGMTMLHDAIRNSSEEVVKLLIYRGANANIKDDRGNTPIYNAGSKNKIDLLLDAGADINVLNNQGESPLCYTIFYGDISTVDFLISRGANINAKDSQGRTVLHHLIYSLLGLIPDIDTIKELEFLISKGADVTIKDNEGKTFLDMDDSIHMTHSIYIKAILILTIAFGILHRNIKIILFAITLVTIFTIILSKIIHKFKKK